MKIKKIIKKIYEAGWGDDVLKVKIVLTLIVFFIYVFYKLLCAFLIAP
jgi:flagellar biogenesis protein FliO